MAKLNFIVEGPTEEAFVRDILVPYLSARGVFPHVRSIETGRHGNRIYRGGMTSYAKAKRDIERWLKQEPASYLTTMFDLYALPTDFPGFDLANRKTCPYKKVELLETKLGEDMGSVKFIPHIQLHEFEALLFSDVAQIDNCMELYGQQGRLDRLQTIIDDYETPEHINTSRETAPSKRLESIYSAYDKVFLGSLISDQIGLEEIQNECVHFKKWLETLSNLED